MATTRSTMGLERPRPRETYSQENYTLENNLQHMILRIYMFPNMFIKCHKLITKIIIKPSFHARYKSRSPLELRALKFGAEIRQNRNWGCRVMALQS